MCQIRTMNWASVSFNAVLHISERSCIILAATSKVPCAGGPTFALVLSHFFALRAELSVPGAFADLVQSAAVFTRHDYMGNGAFVDLADWFAAIAIPDNVPVVLTAAFKDIDGA